MTHDPLCPNIPCDCDQDYYGCEWSCQRQCQCDLIAKVREENRRERVMLEEVVDHYKAYFNQVEKLGWHTGVRDCIAVVRDALKVHYCCGCSEDERIYVEALRALLEKP